MTVFSREWNTGYKDTPADIDDIRDGAETIRDVREDVEERLVVDHAWDLAGDFTEHGKHEGIRLRQQAAKPVIDGGTNDVGFYCKDVVGTPELFYEANDGTEIQLTEGGVTLFLKKSGDTMTGDLLMAAADIVLDNADTFQMDNNAGTPQNILALVADAFTLAHTDFSVDIATDGTLTHNGDDILDENALALTDLGAPGGGVTNAGHIILGNTLKIAWGHSNGTGSSPFAVTHGVNFTSGTTFVAVVVPLSAVSTRLTVTNRTITTFSVSDAILNVGQFFWICIGY